MARRQFSIDEEVSFPTGEVAVVAKIQAAPYRTTMIWLRFPDTEQLVAYSQNDLRAALRRTVR